MVKESERERELTQIAYDHLRKLKVIFFSRYKHVDQ